MDKGPFLVSGDVKVIDAEGNRFNTEKQAALCRCGQSKNMPFCDGIHQGKFEDCVRVKKVL
ncbi:MAG: CDGSH iron-sulfur domain-containing protein [Eubacteriales bacterium]